MAGSESFRLDVSTQRRMTAVDLVLSALRAATLRGGILGDSKLIQTEIATQLGVSTTPVREAMRDLASEGLITLDSHRVETVRKPDWDEMVEIVELRRALEGIATTRAIGRPANSTVTGDMLYNVESGIIATWVNSVGGDLLEPFPYRPELVGQADPEIVLGKGSGLDSVAIWLGRQGIYDAETKEIEAILAEVKGRSPAKKGLLDDNEFLDVVREVIPDRVN